MTETNPADQPLNVITFADNSIALLAQTIGDGGQSWFSFPVEPGGSIS